MSELRDVDITQYYYLCALYAIQRSPYVYTLDYLLNEAGYKFNTWDDVKPGDIVCWDVPDQDVPSISTLIEDNRLLSPHLIINRHFGVVEEGGCVSDLTFLNDNTNTKIPYIRLRKLVNLRLPDRFFTQSLKNGE